MASFPTKNLLYSPSSKEAMYESLFLWRYPTQSPIWIYYPTLIGAAFSFLIAWYDNSFTFKDSGLSSIAAKIGACSYSIYLLHSFIVFPLARQVDTYIFPLTDDISILIASAIAFLCFTPIAYASFK